MLTGGSEGSLIPEIKVWMQLAKRSFLFLGTHSTGLEEILL